MKKAEHFVTIDGVRRNIRFLSVAQKKAYLGYIPRKTRGGGGGRKSGGGGGQRGNPNHDARGRFT